MPSMAPLEVDGKEHRRELLFDSMVGLAPAATVLCAAPLIIGFETTLYTLGILVAICVVIFVIAFAWVRHRFSRPLKGVVGFFHPFADGGGGGERVLWAAVQALQESRPDLSIVIYAGDGSTPEALASSVESRFNLSVAPTFRVVPLHSRTQLLPEHYPRLTMVRQAAASVRVAAEALSVVVPEVWIDTTGWAFPYPMVKLAGAKVAAYVHYPTISTDMLQRVRDRDAMYNNNAAVANSSTLSAFKVFYYHALAMLYGGVGACADVAMVNSSWTRRHIAELWWLCHRPKLVYPPCDTAALQMLPLDRRLKRLYIASVAQFRPEKQHDLQLRAFAAARQRASRLPDPRVADGVLSARLQIVGGCRGPQDEAILNSLKALASDLGLDDESVEFRVNVPFEELRSVLGNAVAGLHTMVDEHFGISVVEYMASGVVPIAHDSGGPREDIVVPEVVGEGGITQRTGYLCRTQEQYCEALVEVLGMEQVERLQVAAAARRQAAKFSDERFKSEFLEAVKSLLPKAPTVE